MRTVAILTPGFFDFDGNTVCNGGAERYLIELCRLLQELGYAVEVFQAASRDWVRQYAGLTIHGLSPAIYQEDTWPATNRRFQDAASHFDHHVYFVFTMAYPVARPGSLAICHSLFWDDTAYSDRRTPSWSSRIELALRQPARIVCNDTNIINWVRATHPDLESKFTWIPNFVDLSRFNRRPRDGSEGSDSSEGQFHVVFPRRLVPQKGLQATLAAAKVLTERDPDIVLHIVGRGLPPDEAAMAELARTTPRLTYGWREPHAMPAVYQMADITLIPTLSAEGTSLSCLEAMACGSPVIAGWVGGLANLIIHEYNGLLVHVTPESLVENILRLKEDVPLRELFAARGYDVAATHSLERWRSNWRRVIQAHLA